ncbi:hypothetical protein bthur0011_48330 [Bacillus thuringiensis serovar huazhongensis BGSC 4BD1]|nr:hypothetical protein bthur0011_48330 [Bacillus thuringiensis serovar huazhongensis BGSC 4BD1]
MEKDFETQGVEKEESKNFMQEFIQQLRIECERRILLSQRFF